MQMTTWRRANPGQKLIVPLSSVGSQLVGYPGTLGRMLLEWVAEYFGICNRRLQFVCLVYSIFDSDPYRPTSRRVPKITGSNMGDFMALLNGDEVVTALKKMEELQHNMNLEINKIPSYQ